jgi:regulator of CtrA degradation
MASMSSEASNEEAGAPIVFGQRFAHSETFKALFREGMSLVEETAAYLDGDGRAESRDLSRGGSLSYATESMRLTTRLMQIASWLLLQRAVNDGEMTTEQALQEKSKVRLRGFGTQTQGAGWDDLPLKLRSLIERSIRLQERVVHLDDALYGLAPFDDEVENQVNRQFGRLARAFGGA